MAQTALVIVLAGLLANLISNVCAAAAGLGYPYSTFLSPPDDRFADFFKLAFSYPGPPAHPAAHHWGLDQLLAHHHEEVGKYEGTRVNHFHVPPVPTLLALAARGLMRWVDPVLLFLACLVAALAWLFATVLRASPKGRTAPALATAALLGYPTLLAIDRGHFFSLICATLTVGGALRTLRDGQADGWSILMFAIAVNIRPNIGVVPLALFLGRRGLSLKAAFILGLASAVAFVAALAMVHQLDPAYSLDSFLRGLRDYGKIYAGGALGYPSGSSLYGALRAVLGYQVWSFAPPLFVAGILFTVAVLEWRRVRAFECLFLVLCAYALGTQIFANYHLLVFVIPLVLLAREEGAADRSGWAILAASSLMLAPKNYLFEFEADVAWSWQVVVNPLILLLASAVVLVEVWRRRVPGSDAAESVLASPA